jgi:hypothetical protein
VVILSRTNRYPAALIVTLLSTGLITGCELTPYEPTGEPFVSEQLVGRWQGDWAVPGLFQEGESLVNVWNYGDGTIDWSMWMSGDFFAADDDEPTLIRLEGVDGIDSLTVEGDTEKLGFVSLTAGADGLITGYAWPDGLPTVDIVGYVTEDTVRLDFLLMLAFYGYAEVKLVGEAEEPPRDLALPEGFPVQGSLISSDTQPEDQR